MTKTLGGSAFLNWRVGWFDSFWCHLFASVLGITAAYEPWKLYVTYGIINHLILSINHSAWSVQAICNAYVNITEKKSIDKIKRKFLYINLKLKTRFPRSYINILIAAAVHVGFQIILVYYTIVMCYRNNPLCVANSIWQIFGIYRLLITFDHYIWIDTLSQLFGYMTECMREGSFKNSVMTFINHYDVLIDGSQRIHGYFRTHNVFIIFISFGGLLSTAFFGSVKYQEEIGITVILASFVHALIPVVLLIRTCTNCADKAEKFNEALASLCIRDKTGTLVKNPYVIAHFAIGKKLKFSACGCFNIDYRLGYSMLAACITYLVILVEFDKKEVVPETSIMSTTSFPT